VLDNKCYGEAGAQASHAGGTESRGIPDDRIPAMAAVGAYAAALQDVTVMACFASVKIDPADLHTCGWRGLAAASVFSPI
jgi:hypothetical protein